MLDVDSVLARQEDAMVEFAPPSTHLSERIGKRTRGPEDLGDAIDISQGAQWLDESKTVNPYFDPRADRIGLLQPLDE